MNKTQKRRWAANAVSTVTIAVFIVSASLLARPALAQQVSKIQQSIDAIKAANYCEDQDYHTDGQRTVWVKSYKRWTPDDWPTIKKEAPEVITFLNQAIRHNRYDVLEQLLPVYYRDHGGVKVFAADAIKAQGNPPVSKSN